MKNPLAGALALAISLLACAQESVGTQPSATNSTAAIPGQTEPVRTIVQFKNPAAINAPAFVQRLQALTPNAVRYVAAVSTDTHVYILQPQPGQSSVQLLQQLNAMPEIARVEFDHKVKAP
jgi:hypothetical protein